MMRRWFGRSDEQDAALDDEIRSHFAMAVADRIARGESPEQAVAAARREFGNVGHVKEVTREMWGGLWLERFIQDLRYALRSLRRSPAFTSVVILTLALGIGVNTAAFTVMNGVLLRPLPYAEPDRLYLAAYAPPRGPFNNTPGLFDFHYLALLENDPVFEHVATAAPEELTLTGGAADSDAPVKLSASSVTTDFFTVLGVRPAIGRTFAPADERASGDGAVIVIGDSLWRSRFSGDPAVIGRSVILDGEPRAIVGVMPPSFRFPSRATLWIPTRVTTSPNRVWMRLVVGRLKPGLTPAAAQEAFAAVTGRFELGSGMHRENLRAELVPLKTAVVGDARQPLLVFAGAILFVLLIACANVANLLLMRAASRDREMGVRAAIGAARGRLVRQVLTETFALSLTGAVLGVLLAFACVRTLLNLAPPGTIPRAAGVRVDFVVLLFTIGLSLVTTVICGFIPALHATDDRLQTSLADGARTVTATSGRLRSMLVVAEIALALVLLTGAGLLLRSFNRLRGVDLGFQASTNLVSVVDLPARRYANVAAMQEYHARVLNGLARIPGVDDAAAVNYLPLGGNLIAGDFHVENGPPLPPGYTADKMVVSPGYFRALGIRLERGRAFTPDDRQGTPPVVIVSQSLAGRFWPHGDAVGKRISLEEHPTPADWMTVVGVVNDVVHNGPASRPDAAIYRPLAQTSQPFFLDHMGFVVHQAKESPAIADAMRRVLRAADPQLPLGAVLSVRDVVDGNSLTERFQSRLLLAFALMALALALVGIYGVLAYGVAQRIHEIGVRIALGATAGNVTAMVLRRSAALAVPGILLGVAASLGLTRVLAKLLFQVKPTDPGTFAAVVLILFAAAVAAAYLPARRASRVDPVLAMRNE